MSQHGPIIAIVTGEQSPLVTAVAAAKLNSVTTVNWTAASQALDLLSPAAVIAEGSAENPIAFAATAGRLAARKPYIPLIVTDPGIPVPNNAIPLSSIETSPGRLAARLRAALRVRALDITLSQRLADNPTSVRHLADTDPLQDATVLLLGRGTSYP